MRLSEQGTKVLWGRSGGRCAKCKRPIIEDADDGHAYPIGDQAHIIGRSRSGPRGETDATTAERADVKNFVLLCGSCHDLIDKARDVWPVQRLVELKAKHEAWVREMGEELSMSELGGLVDVNAANASDVTGVDIASPTRIKPGTRVTVRAHNVGRVTGVRIDASKKERRDA